MSKIKGKIAVVTRSNRGIGYATAKKLKSEGATVVIKGRESGRVKTAAQEFGFRGIVADVKNIFNFISLSFSSKLKLVINFIPSNCLSN